MNRIERNEKNSFIHQMFEEKKTENKSDPLSIFVILLRKRNENINTAARKKEKKNTCFKCGKKMC